MDKTEALRVFIEQEKDKLVLVESLNRLAKNRDFKKLIDQHYLRDYAVELVHLKASPAMADEDNQRDLNNCINGIGQLRQFFTNVTQTGRMAEQKIKQAEAELEAIMRGDDDEADSYEME